MIDFYQTVQKSEQTTEAWSFDDNSNEKNQLSVFCIFQIIEIRKHYCVRDNTLLKVQYRKRLTSAIVKTVTETDFRLYLTYLRDKKPSDRQRCERLIKINLGILFYTVKPRTSPWALFFLKHSDVLYFEMGFLSRLLFQSIRWVLNRY